MEKCFACGGMIKLEQNNTDWAHIRSNGAPACNNPRPGMGLIETINDYYAHPESYSESWERLHYTDNAILHGLRMQATVHWNNCPKGACKNCLSIGQSTADRYMKELTNGRYDLHPNDNDRVYIIAFDIHNEKVKNGTHSPDRGKPGVMTCTYVVGPGSSEACSCYEEAYKQWLLLGVSHASQAIITALAIDPDEMHYEPRFE
jgi:hypothetical protein